MAREKLETGASSAPMVRMRKPAGSRRIFEYIAVEIRQSIAEGKLKPGDRLPTERELAERFRVGRSTIREAIRSLENSSLLTLRRGPGGGAFVAAGDSGAIQTGMSDLMSLGLIKPQHLREAREIIGAAAARLAAERRTSSDLEAIKKNMAQIQEAARQGNAADRSRLSFEFHRLLAHATQNPALVVLTDAVLELNDRMVKIAGLRDPQIGIRFRHKMLAYLEARDGAAAAAEMEDYLENLRIYYQSKLKSSAS